MAGNRGRGEGWVAGQLVLFAAIGLAPWLLPGAASWPEGLRLPAALAGIALGLAGAAVGGLGALQLGTNLTIFPRPKEDGALVESGVYGLVRHPIYTGVLLCGLGYALVTASAIALLLCVGLWLFFEQKARREERWLRDQFPAYEGYMRRVPGRILPRR
jgi:protein-S-isoprenylcysteine O-methyltransferase Ste14